MRDRNLLNPTQEGYYWGGSLELSGLFFLLTNEETARVTIIGKTGISEVRVPDWSNYIYFSSGPRYHWWEGWSGESQSSICLQTNLYLIQDVGKEEAGVGQEEILPSGLKAMMRKRRISIPGSGWSLPSSTPHPFTNSFQSIPRCQAVGCWDGNWQASLSHT